jgi:iron complex outermembrane recepter protein
MVTSNFYFIRPTMYKFLFSTPHFFTFFFLLSICHFGIAAQAPVQQIKGTVVDPTGAVIPNATIQLKASDSSYRETKSDAQGQFLFENLLVGKYELQVQATGFIYTARLINLGKGKTESISIAMKILVTSEQMDLIYDKSDLVFLETRQATVITTFTPKQIQFAAAQTVDDLLRQVPGFSNFRRSSSLVANPTTQGVSLRGAGASGASRTAVIADGIPLNDAFGGWVYWDRIPREAIQSVEVERGGASHLYGSDALSGAINLTTRRANKPTLSASASVGNLNTADTSFFAGSKFGKLNLAVFGEAFKTDGYFIVSPTIRGIADTHAASNHRALTLRTGFEFDANNAIFVSGSLYDQNRKNGTVLQTNDTTSESVAVRGQFLTPDKSNWTISLYGNQQRYHQSFTAVAANRATETLSRLQFTPAHDAGIKINWSHATNGVHTLFAGFEVRGVRGTSDETVFANNRATTFVSAGGRQRRIGFFAQDYISINKHWALVISGRFDQWRDSSAASVSRALATGIVTPTFFAPRSVNVFNPRVALIYKVTNNFELRASGYRAFRAPTLNELYRSFRVGDTLTQSNNALTAERLTGGEAGLNWNLNNKITSRLTGYYTEIVNPIANFTISTTPTLITRQRRNLGRTRSAGIEAEVEMKVTNQIRFSSGYLYSNAIVKRAPQDLTLVGLQIPQVPRQQFTMQASYDDPRYVNAALQFRASSRQFDDDRNTLPLNSYALIDATVSRRLGKYLEGFFAVQNVLNKQFVVARTPLENFGMPRMFRGGVRIRFE